MAFVVWSRIMPRLYNPTNSRCVSEVLILTCASAKRGSGPEGCTGIRTKHLQEGKLTTWSQLESCARHLAVCCQIEMLFPCMTTNFWKRVWTAFHRRVRSRACADASCPKTPRGSGPHMSRRTQKLTLTKFQKKNTEFQKLTPNPKSLRRIPKAHPEFQKFTTFLETRVESRPQITYHSRTQAPFRHESKMSEGQGINLEKEDDVEADNDDK